MSISINTFWWTRMEKCSRALIQNHFDAYLVKSLEDAECLVTEEIIQSIKPKTISWGGSQTLSRSKILKQLRSDQKIGLLTTFEQGGSFEEKWERCRQALLADLYLSGTNAVTETGVLVNLDMWGNRVGALTFGPNHVVILAGRNKIVPDVDAAVERVKRTAAPINAIRHSHKEGRDTPCSKDGECVDCSHPKRICNTWNIIEKSFPPQRIKVILINEDLGF
jgi:hypothetical protein